MSAYLTAGRVQDAERILAWLDEMVPRLPCKFPRIAAATGRAQLAEFRGDRHGANGHYHSALALHEEVDLPVEHCETLLAYGGFLRRAGWAARARPVLARAAEVAQKAGALWLAGFAHAELKGAGGRLRRRAAPGTLSPQEKRVAALAATGTANTNIARQMCLSVSTVETHLERIYAKLGIHTRYQLIAMADAQVTACVAASSPDSLPGGVPNERSGDMAGQCLRFARGRAGGDKPGCGQRRATDAVWIIGFQLGRQVLTGHGSASIFLPWTRRARST